MSDTNQVIICGRLTRDSELKFTNGGTALAKVSIAVNRFSKVENGQRTEEVSFFDVAIWGKQAESLNQYLTKGKQIIVTGELRQERWEKDGQNRSRVEINARNIQLIGSKEREDKKEAEQRGPGPEDFGDDIPF